MTEKTSGCGFERIGIVGVGLMGGAFARGLKALDAPPHVAGYSPPDLGPGGKDMVRLAASSPRIWRDLLDAAAPQLAGALENVGVELKGMAAALESGNVSAIAALMARTKEWKESG